MDAGLLVLALIIILSVAGMACIITSFFVDKPKYIPPKKIHPMKQKPIEDDTFTVLIRDWE